MSGRGRACVARIPRRAGEPSLRDVQHALAREHGLPGWTALKQRVAGDGVARRRSCDLIRPDELASDRAVWTLGQPRLRCLGRHRRRARRRCGGAAPAARARIPNLVRYGEPLHFAVREGHLEAVRVLLDAGADPMRRSRQARR